MFGVLVETSIGTLGALGAAALAAFTGWRNSKKINEVHVLVNSRLETALSRIDRLTEALEGSDTEVPPDDQR